MGAKTENSRLPLARLPAASPLAHHAGSPATVLESLLPAVSRVDSLISTIEPVAGLRALARQAAEHPLSMRTFLSLYAQLARGAERRGLAGAEARMQALATQPWSKEIDAEWRALEGGIGKQLPAKRYWEAVCSRPDAPPNAVARTFSIALHAIEEQGERRGRARAEGKLRDLMSTMALRFAESDHPSEEAFYGGVRTEAGEAALLALLRRRTIPVDARVAVLRLAYPDSPSSQFEEKARRFLRRAPYDEKNEDIYERLNIEPSDFLQAYANGRLRRGAGAVLLHYAAELYAHPSPTETFRMLRVLRRAGWSKALADLLADRMSPMFVEGLAALLPELRKVAPIRTTAQLLTLVRESQALSQSHKGVVLAHALLPYNNRLTAADASDILTQLGRIDDEEMPKLSGLPLASEAAQAAMRREIARAGERRDPVALRYAELAISILELPFTEAIAAAATVPWSAASERFWVKRVAVMRESRGNSATVDAGIEIVTSLAQVEGIPDAKFTELLEQITTTVGDHYRLALALSAVLSKRPWNPSFRRIWGTVFTEEAQKDTEREKSLGISALPAEIRPQVRKPNRLERLTRMMNTLALSSRERVALHELAGRGDLWSLSGLVLAPGERLRQEVVSAAFEDAVHSTESDRAARLTSDGYSVWPSPSMTVDVERLSRLTGLASSSMVIIGDGAAALMMARLRQELGYDRGATTIVGARGTSGGIWNYPFVLGEGHNTFQPFEAFNATIPAVEPRPGSDITAFLESLNSSSKQTVRIQGEARQIDWDAARRKYKVTYAQGGASTSVFADSVYIATGNRIPRSLERGPMETNAHTMNGAPLRRWQRQIPESEYSRYQGAAVLCVGLGNSTMAMIGECLKMKNAGVDVRPIILTHYSEAAVRNPRQVVQTAGGTVQGPLYRGPFNLSRIAGDIPRIRERYEQALAAGWIMSDVERWDIEEFHGRGQDVRSVVGVRSRDGTTRQIENIADMYALVGYQNDPDLMRRLGCVVDPLTGVVEYEGLTGRVRTTFQDDSKRVYIGGAAASRPNDRNHEVIPGMGTTTPMVAFAEIISATGDLLNGASRAAVGAVKRS